MQIFDEDSVKEVQAEDRAYRDWEREQKNRILNMSKPEKKIAVWQRLFPLFERDDNYLAGNVF